MADKRKPLTKRDMERICRTGGLQPVARTRMQGREVFVADGESKPPHTAYRRFGIGPEQFPRGMFVTMWWSARGEEGLNCGSFLFCEPDHDPLYSAQGKQELRIKAAVKDAHFALVAQRKKAMN